MIRAILTIDDYASQNTPAIVDFLNDNNIPAIMFAVGENVERYYDEAIYALSHNIIVGNHSYSHPAFSEISLEEGIEDIEHNERVLDKLYKDAGVPRLYRPFRFPYGNKGGENKEFLQRYLREKDFDKVVDDAFQYDWWIEAGLDRDIDTLWTFDFAEYNIRPNSGFTKENVWEKMHEMHPQYGAPLLLEDSNHLLLLHAHDETEELVPEYYKEFLSFLLQKGVVFVKPEFRKMK